MAELSLYPTEEIAIKEVYTTLSRKFMGKADTKENLIAFATEATNRFKEIGFLVNVDVTTVDLMDDKVVMSPTIELVDRIKKEESHDHERHSAEVQAGLADGTPGRITEDGRLVDPATAIHLPEGSAFKKA